MVGWYAVSRTVNWLILGPLMLAIIWFVQSYSLTLLLLTKS